MSDTPGGAFSAMAKRLPAVTPKDDNVVVFNPYPYEYHGYAEAEFLIEDALGSETQRYKLSVVAIVVVVGCVVLLKKKRRI